MKSVADVIDYTFLSGDQETQARIWNVRDAGFYSFCIPEISLEKSMNCYPKMRFTTVANYPYGYHNSETTLQEIKSIYSQIEDLDRLTIDFILPTDALHFLDEFMEVSEDVRLTAVFKQEDLKHWLAKMPCRDQPFEAVCIGTDFHDETDLRSIQKDLEKFHHRGYRVKLSGQINSLSRLKEALNVGADIVGTRWAKNIIEEEKNEARESVDST